MFIKVFPELSDVSKTLTCACHKEQFERWNGSIYENIICLSLSFYRFKIKLIKVCLYVLKFPYCSQKNIRLFLEVLDQWHVSMSVWMSVFWNFFKTFLFPTPCVDCSWKQQLCAVEVCRTPQWNWNWCLLFCLFFPFKKNCCAEPRIVSLVVSLLWLLAKAGFSAWNILLGD